MAKIYLGNDVSTNPLDAGSRALAGVLGDQHGRTATAVTAVGTQVIWKALAGRQLSTETAKDVVHGLMLLDTFLLLQKNTRPTGAVGALALLGLFQIGLSQPVHEQERR